MAFNGSEGGEITLEVAAAMTKNYRNANRGATKAHFFGKDILNDILNQTGCVGIRMYYGIDAAGLKQLVIVGADANENDMTTGIIGDMSLPCPNLCSTANSLNS